MEWPGGPGKLAKILTDALPGTSESIGFVEPDVVGEAFARQVVRGLPRSEQGKAVLRAAKQTQAAVSFVVLTIQDLSADEVPEPMEWLNGLIEAGAADDDLDLLETIEAAMPVQTLRLAEAAIRATQTLLDRLATMAEILPDVSVQTSRARVLSNLAARLDSIGRHDEALECADGAVRILKRLAQSDPESFLPILAACLHNRATVCESIGEHDEAIATFEGLSANLQTAKLSSPEVFLPYLAMSFNNLAKALLGVAGKRKHGTLEGSEGSANRRAVGGKAFAR